MRLFQLITKGSIICANMMSLMIKLLSVLPCLTAKAGWEKIGSIMIVNRNAILLDF
jgi:hypothetical protein